MRPFLVTLLAGFLGVTLAVVPTGFSPAQTAHAYACLSSIDPKCNPGNIPILIDAGVIAAPKVGQTVVASAVPPATASTGLVRDLTALGAATLATVGVLGITMDLGDGFKGRPALHQNGLGKLDIATDPAFRPPGALTLVWGGTTTCKGWPGTDGVPSAGQTGQTCTGPFPFRFARSSGALVEVAVFADRLTFTSITSTTYSTFNSMQLRPFCGSEARTAGNVVVNGGFSSGSVRTVFLQSSGAPALCPSGAQVNRVVVTGPFAADGSQASATVWAAQGMLTGDVMTGTTTASVDCKGPGGVQTITASAPYSVVPGQPIQSPEVVCPAGTIAIGAEVEMNDGSTTTSVIPREQNDVIPRISELVELLPHCFGPAAVPCPMVLQRLDAGTWQDCGPNGTYCPTWAQTPEPTLTQLYRCLVGGVVVDIRYCSAYRAPLIGVLPNVGPDGELLPPSAPAPSAGNLYSPTPPNGGPSTGAPPGWLEIIDLEREDTTECFPTGWGMLNPVSWVLMPVGCALEAAFVPRQEVLNAQAAALSTAFSASAVGSVVVEVAGIIPDTVPNGCEGIPFSLAGFAAVGGPELGLPSDTIYIAAACEGDILHPWSVFVRVLLTGAILVVGVRAVVGQIGALVNAGGPAG